MTISMKLQDSFNEGHAQGIVFGQIEERLFTIRMLMKNGMSHAQIASLYQMTEEELLAFVKEHEAPEETE